MKRISHLARNPIRFVLFVLALAALTGLAGACSSGGPTTPSTPESPAPAVTAKVDVTVAPTREPTSESNPESNSERAETPAGTPSPAAATAGGAPAGEGGYADVISVNVSGQPGAYQFAVGIKSPDTGCDQYADWWEVITPDGRLLYRRILLHSHVGEQPFVRSGGPAPIQPETQVLIRAHMNTSGYGGALFQGSVQEGFTPAPGDPELFPELAQEEPLPSGCAF